MRYDPGDRLRYSPKDLIVFLEGDFASWMDRLAAERSRPGADPARFAAFADALPDQDAELEILRRQGIEHESRYLATLKASGTTVVEIEKNDTTATLAAMRNGVPVIYQAALDAAGLDGYPDFLVRVDGGSTLGPWHYEPWDTKLARSAKPYFLIQLAAYAEMLEEIQGRRPAGMVFVLGNGVVDRHRVDDVFHYYRRLKRSFSAYQKAWALDGCPLPTERTPGRWSEYAKHLRAKRDHPSGIAGITRSQIHRLVDAGLLTRRDIAHATHDAIPRMKAHIWERIRRQAQLQLQSPEGEAPAWDVIPPTAEEPRRGLALLPPASEWDVFFDLEGFPFGDGLEYLWGVVTRDTGSPVFTAWWAHDPDGERLAFAQFMDWVHARWTAHPEMRIYHYADYERGVVQKLMGRYATREDPVDDLLRAEAFVDLYRVVRQGVRVGTPSYSLKEIERLYRPARAGEVKSAGASVVEYQRWIDSGEPADPAQSPILEAIRAYNEDDCVSTLQLRDWLDAQQAESGLAYVPRKEKPKEEAEAPPVERPRAVLAARLLARAAGEADSEARRVTELVAWLLEYHRREEKPMWWWLFKRHGSTEEELWDDLDCLAGLVRTERAPVPAKRSFLHEYRYDPDQDTKRGPGDKCYYAHDLDEKTEIASIDPATGLVEIKLLKGRVPPDHLSLIPDELVSAKTMEEAIQAFAESWETGAPASRAVDDLLRRRPPRLAGRNGGPVLTPGADLVTGTIDAVRLLDESVLSIQGPPGTGKTYVAAEAIAGLLQDGKSVAVTSNSHRAIQNLLVEVKKAQARHGVGGTVFRVDKDDLGDGALGIVRLASSGDVAETIGTAGSLVVGGTAWVFSRGDLRGRFDHLFVDEAGQVSLANVVAMGMGARNIVLIGDQMQLAQPVKGSHPGQSGASSLVYRLAGHATIPPELGIFLDRSRRMHPEVCRFISDAVYEGRLASHEVAQGRSLATGGALPETGAWWMPVRHEDCAQASDQEVAAIREAVAHLLEGEVVEADGRRRPLAPKDILVVAPFNMQVRKLQQALGPTIRVGTVDKFQGQEAEVVLVSLTSSTREDAPRGSAFLLSPNRLNVAVSRAKLLALVFGCPDLLDGRCSEIDDMKRVNLLCRLPERELPEGHMLGQALCLPPVG